MIGPGFESLYALFLAEQQDASLKDESDPMGICCIRGWKLATLQLLEDRIEHDIRALDGEPICESGVWHVGLGGGPGEQDGAERHFLTQQNLVDAGEFEQGE